MTIAIMAYAAFMQTVAVALLVVQSRFMWRAGVRGGAAFEYVEVGQETEGEPEQIVSGGIPDAAQLHEVMRSPRLTNEEIANATQPYNMGMYL